MLSSYNQPPITQISNIHTPDSSVIMKLLAFTLGMIVFPIGSYFLTVDTLFKGV